MSRMQIHVAEHPFCLRDHRINSPFSPRSPHLRSHHGGLHFSFAVLREGGYTATTELLPHHMLQLVACKMRSDQMARSIKEKQGKRKNSHVWQASNLLSRHKTISPHTFRPSNHVHDGRETRATYIAPEYTLNTVEKFY